MKNFDEYRNFYIANGSGLDQDSGETEESGPRMTVVSTKRC